MKRLHVHVGVDNLDQSIGFYSALFGAQPSVTKSDYAKWMLEDPRVNFAISCKEGAAKGVEHLGIQVEDQGELAEVYDRLKAADRPVLIEVDLAGARSVKRALPDAVTVFLAPPSREALRQRLIGRGTETAEIMARRLATADVELAAQDEFDMVIVNSRLESACSELVTLLVGNAPQSA